MSSRAIRRLREETEGALLREQQDSDDEETSPKQGAGFLEMLDESSDESDDDSGDRESDDDSSEDSHRPRKAAVIKEPKARREEDIDAILSSFHDDRDEPQSQSPSDTAIPTLRSLLLSASHGYDLQALDLDNAMRSLLGSGVDVGNNTESGRQQRGRRKVATKKYFFGRPRDNWGKPPSFVGGGLGCKELTERVLKEERNSWGVPWPYKQVRASNDDDDGHGANDYMPIFTQQKWYTLTMSDTYQEQHYAYQQLLRSRNIHAHASTDALQDPNALAMFVADHPHFADTLLQLSMVLYHVNDRSKGNDLLRRTMYLYERALPASVLPNNSNDYRHELFMDIDRQPNAGLFATLFRIMQTSGMTGCFPNALATGRFLLSLDPLRDPMGVLLILDYYALAWRQSVLDGGRETGAHFVKELVESEMISIHYKDPLTDRHHWCRLVDMPGWAYSYALALYRLSNSEEECQDKNGDLGERADEALMDALTRFPSVLSKLLAMNKVNTQDRSFVIDWPMVLPRFTGDNEVAGERDSVQDRVAKGAGNHLVRIFVQRHYKLWAGGDVIQWMYCCAEKVAKKKIVPSDDYGENDLALEAHPEPTSSQPSTETQDNSPRLHSKFQPALARYAQFDPSEYEDAFRTLPPEAIALDPNIIAPAMEFNPNRRGRFLRRGQMPDDVHLDGSEGLMLRLREAFGMGMGHGEEMEMLDPDSPLLQLYLQSLLPWNHVEGVRPPR